MFCAILAPRFRAPFTVKTRLKPAPLALACLFAPAAMAQPLGLPPLEVDPALLGAPVPPKAEAKPSAAPPGARAEPKAPPAGEPPAGPESPPPAAPAAEMPPPGGLEPATPGAKAPPPPVGPARPELGLALRASPQLAPVPTDQPLPAFLTADRVQGVQDQYLEAEGDVDLRRYGQSVQADRLRYETAREEVQAQGNVRLSHGDTLLEGTRARLNLETRQGRLEAPRYLLVGEPAGRGGAEEILLEGDRLYRAREASFTMCPAGVDDWFLRAADLSIDRNAQVGVARHARLDFLGVPILYSPYIDFPLTEDRKSGLLPPVVGTTKTTGTDIMVPYYWNIAPNMDATLAPRFMSKRGVMLDAEYRYLFRDFSGVARGDWLGNDSETDTDRWALSLQHNHNLGHGFGAAVNYQRVSDDNFLRDFGNRVAVTSLITLPQEGYVTYSGGWWSAVARYQTFQTLQDPAAPIIPPYNREPQFLVSASRQNLRGFDLAFSGEYVDFRNPLTTQLSGDRLLLFPSVSYPLVTPGGFLVPKASLHYAKYTFTNPSSREDQDLTVPIYSLDGGLRFERRLALGGEHYTQTLEPRAFYVNAPFREQNGFPVYDTAEADFSFAQLFLENRFLGGDRVNDANQLTIALTSRLLHQDGRERARLSLGQRFYFDSPRVSLDPLDPGNQTKSDFLAAFTGRVAENWLADAAWQYDPADARTRKGSFQARYQPGPGRVVNFGYRYTFNELEQLGGSFQWPLGRGWWGMGVVDYSLQDSRTLNAVAGVEYNSACWALRFVVQRFATTVDTSTNQFFIQLELRGLAKLGVDPLDVLRQTIPGYTQTPAPGTPGTGAYGQ
jgi:LPS-assembly protein